MCWLRLYNIINTWTKQMDTRVDKLKNALEGVFMKIEVEDTLDDGSTGKRVINFTKNLPSSIQIKAHEDLLKGRGKNIKNVYLNPELLSNMDITWKITIVPTEKDSDAIDKAQFTADISEGYQLFGPQDFNKENVKTIWAQKRKLDRDQLFVKPQQQQQMMAQGMAQPQNNVNNQLRQAGRAAPTIPQLANA